VSYTYDQVNRLATAVSATGGTTNWGLSFSYDVYGNRTAQTVTAGSAPAFSASFGSNNRMVGYSYDNNGNQLTTPDGATLEYDPDNRLTKWTKQGQVDQYQYHPSGWRLSKGSEKYLYGPGGQLLESYRAWNDITDYVYFGGRLLYTLSGDTAVTRIYSDRLGSTRATETIQQYGGGWTTRNYYPFGEEITSTASDQYKFASTYRDSATGLDYAINRYYASGTARFLTPDPYQASGGPADPQSWNRYAYALNDPVNYKDPGGRLALTAEYCNTFPDDPDCHDGMNNFGRDDGTMRMLLGTGGVCLSFGGGGTSNAPARRRPAYLKVKLSDDDCYRPNAGAPGVWTREVKYTLYGDDNEVFDYMQGAVISEHLELTWGDEKPPESSSKDGFTFPDTISVGNSGPFDVKQTFTVSVWGQEFKVDIIDRLGRRRSSNFIQARADSILIENDTNGGGKNGPRCKTQF
jgi:RHS repeat-associated protein